MSVNLLAFTDTVTSQPFLPGDVPASGDQWAETDQGQVRVRVRVGLGLG